MKPEGEQAARAEFHQVTIRQHEFGDALAIDERAELRPEILNGSPTGLIGFERGVAARDK